MKTGSKKKGARTGTERAAPRLIALGGGKGGIGKTFLAANLSVALSRLGLEVVAVDADLEGSNLHTCLGVEPPPMSLADFVADREVDVGKLAAATSIPNLRLIAATHANLWSPQPSDEQRVALVGHLRKLPADIVLIDLGAGTHPAVMDYYLSADEGVVVFAPEPTSVENGYSFMRAAFYRGMHRWMSDEPLRDLIAQAMDQHNERGIRTPLDLLRAARALDPAGGRRLEKLVHRLRPRIILNEARSATDIKMGFAIKSVCLKYFGIEADYLGYVNHDDVVRKSVLARKPLVLSHPKSDAAIYVGRIARKLAAGSFRSKAVRPKARSNAPAPTHRKL